MSDHDAKHEAHRRLLRRLEDQAGEAKRLTDGLDDGVLARRVVEGKWSLKELVGHLLRVQQVFEERLGLMLASDAPRFTSWNPENDPAFDRMLERGSRQVIDAFLAARAALVARLSTLGPAEWHRTGQHPEYPSYDVHFMIEYLAHHEAHHLYQMYQRRGPLGKIPHA